MKFKKIKRIWKKQKSWVKGGIIGVTIISNPEDVSANVSKIANATVPHAMKSVAGLYRLFWDTVHSYEWPTFHHDNQRTGFTILKGDIGGASDVRRNSIVLKGTTNEDFTRSSAADIDGDGIIDVVSVVAESGDHDLKIFGTESTRGLWNGEIKTYQRWVYPESGSFVGELHAPPSLGNIDSDSDKEIIFGLLNGSFYALNILDGESVSDKWSSPYTVNKKYSEEADDWDYGQLSFSAVVDVNNDGANEIIFSDAKINLPDWNGELNKVVCL